MFAPDLLQERVVLVTGGRSGIGYAIAKLCLQAGARVVIASRKEELLHQAAQELGCEAFACDIREPEAIERLADFIQERFGRLDILFNNAGGQFPSAAENISHKGWNAVINNNLNGTWYMTQGMANRFLIPQQSGSIVNIIANIYRGFPGMAHTAAARAGVDNLTKTLAVEWSRYGIRINAIAPGIIQSSGLDNYPPELLSGIAESIPMRRLGTVDEVAQLSVFVAQAAYMTGETVYLDGGQRLWGDMLKF